MNDISDYLFSAIRLVIEFIPFAAAIIAGIALPTTVVIVAKLISKYPDYLRLTAILTCVVMGSTLSIAFSGRVIVNEADIIAHPDLLLLSTAEQGNVWFSRGAHLVLLSLSLSEIFLWIIKKRNMDRSQITLWGAAMSYYIITVLVSGIFGNFRELNVKAFYAPIVFTAIALLATADYQRTLKSLRYILLVPLCGSLLGIWLAPHLVLETGYKSLIPGLNIRLAGLTEHANSLGIISVIFLFVELSPFVNKKVNAIFVFIAVANLILAQSKTAWIICLLVILIFILKNFPKLAPQSGKRDFVLPIVSATLLLFSISTFLAWLNIESLARFIEVDQFALASFTGRTKIWDITWNEFLNNPLLGYGPSIWDATYRLQRGMSYVGQAHNQYMQTLGQAGMLGIISLAFYVILLIKGAYRSRYRTSGFGLMIVFVLLARGFSESPMRMLGIMGFDNFVHLFTFATIATMIYQLEKAPLNGLYKD